MPYSGSDFTMADLGSTVTYYFDFTPSLATGETIVSASWTCTTAADSQVQDASAPFRVSGSATVNGAVVGQKFTGYLSGVKYLVEATAVTSLGNTITCWSHFYCDSPV